jgi:hypothetical protein
VDNVKRWLVYRDFKGGRFWVHSVEPVSWALRRDDALRFDARRAAHNVAVSVDGCVATEGNEGSAVLPFVSGLWLAR